MTDVSSLRQPAPPDVPLPPGSTYIYKPRGRAREYAALAANLYDGCSHGCLYCYGPAARYKSREDFHRAGTRGPGFLRLLERDAARFSRAEVTGQVLLCRSCDPYQPIDEELKVTRQAIQALHRHGLSVQILTKGGARALRDIDLLGAGDAFATTLTLLDDAESLHWEPGAAPPSERILVLEAFHRAGVPTWVSLEPVIRPADSLELIRRTAAFTDLYRVGKMNHYRLPWPVDWRQFALDTVALLESLGKPYYLKADLAAYLED